jgi:hypothetical protein
VANVYTSGANVYTRPCTVYAGPGSALFMQSQYGFSGQAARVLSLTGGLHASTWCCRVKGTGTDSTGLPRSCDTVLAVLPALQSILARLLFGTRSETLL